MTYRRQGFLLGLAGLASLLALACVPAAEPTATTATQPTATTPAQPTATRPAQPTVTTGSTTGLPTATPSAAGATATVSEVRVRPVPVVNPPGPNPQAQKGGTYRFLRNIDPPNFWIWASANANSHQPAVPAYDTLLDTNEYEPNKADQLLPSMAYDWWLNQAGDQWTFKLREGIKFTDGKVLSCADVKFSLETIRDSRDATGSVLPTSPRGAYIHRIKDITCPDPNTVLIKTDGAMPSLLRTLALTTFSILPKHVFEGQLQKFDKTIGPGQGPFMFESYTPTESVKLKRNPNYWNQPYPYMDQFQIINAGSVSAEVAAFRVGRGESSESIPKPVRDELESSGKIYVGLKTANDGFNAVHTNWQKAPFNDKRFALALRCAIDGQKVIDTVQNGEGFEGPVFPLGDVPGGSPWAITKEQWKALGPCYGTTKDTNMEQRRQMAKDLLAQMGFTAQNPAKPQVVWPNSTSSKDQWTVITGDLAAVGIQPTVTFLATADIYPKFAAGEVDMGTPAGFATSRRDPDHWLYEHYYSTSARNYGKYVNAEADVLMDRQSKTLDPVERKKLINQVDLLLTKDQAKIVVFHGYSTRPYPIWVKDFYWGQPTNSQSTASKYTRTWIDQAVMKQVLG